VEPLRAVVLTGACGDLKLTVEILDVDGSAKVVPVTVPCPASTGGDDDDDTNPGNGGDDGSNDNGSDNGSNTGNTNNGNTGGSADKSDDTSKSVDTQKITSGNYSTGDTAFGIPQGLIMGGGALVAVAIVMVVVGLVRSRVNSEV